MEHKDFRIGQTVYLQTVSYYVERWMSERLLTGVVTSICDGYIVVKISESGECKFSIKSGLSLADEYPKEYRLFLSKQEAYDNWWRAHLLTAIREELLKRGDKLSIVTLEQIADLIEILADTHTLHGRRVPHKLD